MDEEQYFKMWLAVQLASVAFGAMESCLNIYCIRLDKKRYLYSLPIYGMPLDVFLIFLSFK